jgi:hypothetical protein
MATTETMKRREALPERSSAIVVLPVAAAALVPAAMVALALLAARLFGCSRRSGDVHGLEGGRRGGGCRGDRAAFCAKARVCLVEEAPVLGLPSAHDLDGDRVSGCRRRR